MDDIGNIIYILFVAISLIAGIWQNWKKQKKEAQERKQAPQPSTSSEEAYDPVFDQEEFEVKREIVSEKDRRAAERLAEMERAAEEARKGRRLKKRSLLEEQDSEEEEIKAAVDVSDFDAKKAVIYSEILNPPYL